MTHQIRHNGGFSITGDWKILSRRLKARFAELTESDIMFETGEENDLIRRIGNRLNKKHEEVVDLLRSLGHVKRRIKRSKIFILPIHW